MEISKEKKKKETPRFAQIFGFLFSITVLHLSFFSSSFLYYLLVLISLPATRRLSATLSRADYDKRPSVCHLVAVSRRRCWSR